MNRNIVLLSTADWDNPFWTNKQHVAVSLASRGFRIFYIDSLGLRKPSASSSDLSRIWKKVKKSFAAPTQVRENIFVWSPIVLPFQKNGVVRAFNKIALSVWLRFWQWRLGFEKAILWTYNPITTQLLNVSRFTKIIYHCVDEIKAQPGMPVELLENSELRLCEKADVVFTTALELYNTRSVLNTNTYYFSNVADYNHFNAAMDEKTPIPDDINKYEKPVVGFIGAISGYKLDFELIRKIANRCPEYDFVFIGKVGEGDPWTSLETLQEVPNIHFLGPRDYKLLPGYLKAFKVAILPNKINQYTDSMFPMKFFEYLAAGRTIVSVDLKSLAEFRDYCYISGNVDEFAENLKCACKNPEKGQKERLHLASKYTYDSRTDKMLKIIQGK